MSLITLFIVLAAASLLSYLPLRQNGFLRVLAVFVAGVELAAAYRVLASVFASGTYAWQGYLAVDAVGAVLVLMLALVGSAVGVYSVGYLGAEMRKGIIGPRRVRQYFALLYLFLLAMFFAVSTTSPILAWIAIEATTLSTAFLISFYGKSSSLEAAWKYLMVNSIGLLSGMFGTILFLYPALHAGAGLASWAALAAAAPGFNPFVLKIAFVFVLVGYGTKVGLVPMHTWLPDAHSKAPAPVSALLSGVLLNVAFFLVLKYLGIIDAVVGPAFPHGLLIFFGLLSLAVAALIIFVQKNYKRLLAYSSIEHMGITALGFGFGGIAAAAALLHMLYHSLAKSLLFLSAGNIFVKFSSTKIERVSGAITVLPVTGVLFMLGFLAITGVPPFGTFITEFSILAGGIAAHPYVVLAALFALALVFIGFLKRVASMMFGDAPEGLQKGEAGIWTLAPAIGLAAVLCILSVYLPFGLHALLAAASSI
ncbi:MAG: hydrogenase 4 subunit F [Patescibacteria group bacterium]|nr:hydrogenase 4 subunit F [Patescibacteria group bacterium]